jgi:hypothetical protein
LVQVQYPVSSPEKWVNRENRKQYLLKKRGPIIKPFEMGDFMQQYVPAFQRRKLRLKPHGQQHLR